MADKNKELAINEKKELEEKKEHTIPGKRYVPVTDIVETDAELLLYMDMPGVKKDDLKIKLENNILNIEGHIDTASYSDLKPIYTEYNIGDYVRRFELSNKIDQTKIEAKIDDGVLSLILPKAPELQPKQIQVN